MAFIRIKTIKDVKYYYLVQSIREDGKVKQKILQYFGTTLPDGYVVPTKETRPVVVKETIKKASGTEPMGKVEPSVVLTLVTTTPVPTTVNLRLTGGRGGNRHPIAVKQFILDHLAQVGEDIISNMHQAYNDALDQLAIARSNDMSIPKNRRRTTYYHHPGYHSFSTKVWELITKGLVERSGREELSDKDHFLGMKNKPIRKYYRLRR